MTSVGLPILIIAMLVAPGAIFFVFLYGFNSIRRTSISFGPAIDLSFLLSISAVLAGFTPILLSNLPPLLYSCNIDFGSRAYDYYASFFISKSPSLSACSHYISREMIYVSFLTILYVAGCLAYLLLLTIENAVLPIKFAHGEFIDIAIFMRHNVDILCSVLTKFGGEVKDTNSYVIYMGWLDAITINESHEIKSLSIKDPSKGVVQFVAGDDGRHNAIESEQQAISPNKDSFLIVPGESIENILIFGTGYVAVKFMTWMQIIYVLGKMICFLLAAFVVIYGFHTIISVAGFFGKVLYVLIRVVLGIIVGR